jgi:hypothetical protein
MASTEVPEEAIVLNLRIKYSNRHWEECILNSVYCTTKLSITCFTSTILWIGLLLKQLDPVSASNMTADNEDFLLKYYKGVTSTVSARGTFTYIPDETNPSIDWALDILTIPIKPTCWGCLQPWNLWARVAFKCNADLGLWLAKWQFHWFL